MAISEPTYHRDSEGQIAKQLRSAVQGLKVRYCCAAEFGRHRGMADSGEPSARRVYGGHGLTDPMMLLSVIVAGARKILPVARPAAAVVGGRVAVRQRPHIFEAAHVVVIAEPVQAQAPRSSRGELCRTGERTNGGEDEESDAKVFHVRYPCGRGMQRVQRRMRESIRLVCARRHKGRQALHMSDGLSHREIHRTWPAAIDGYRRQTSRRENAAPTRRRVFGATNRPDGQISDRNENLSSPISKNISLSPSGKSALPARAISSPKRGVGHRHERGMGCGGRGSVGAQSCSQGGFRERATARRTNGAGCVRQNRVVPTPVAGAKLPVAN